MSVVLIRKTPRRGAYTLLTERRWGPSPMQLKPGHVEMTKGDRTANVFKSIMRALMPKMQKSGQRGT